MYIILEVHIYQLSVEFSLLHEALVGNSEVYVSHCLQYFWNKSLLRMSKRSLIAGKLNFVMVSLYCKWGAIIYIAFSEFVSMNQIALWLIQLTKLGQHTLQIWWCSYSSQAIHFLQHLPSSSMWDYKAFWML